VNCICPGYIDSGLAEVTSRRNPIRPRLEQRSESYTLFGAIGQPEEVARVAVFLASDDTSFITGSAMGVTRGFGYGIAPV
jgi:NAD(P)-dependent dehydrogenase (short-subunit alcohol dehydrogenase family)